MNFSPNISSDATFLIRNSADDSNRLSDVIAMQIGLSNDEKQEVLNIVDVEERIDRVHVLLEKELQRLQLLDKIQNKVRGDIDKAQRDYVLREQLKAIQSELNDVDDENDAEEPGEF